MSHDTFWDIDAYRADYESDEHWALRRQFMEVHKGKFPEDELVCLAQVFINVEFLGCKYPDETMKLVGELSQDVAKDFRESRTNRLKRTFVKASDAAEARAKGIRGSHKPTSHTETSSGAKAKPKLEKDLFEGLPFGNFVLFQTNKRTAIRNSGKKCEVDVVEKRTTEGEERKVEVFVGGKLAGTGRAPIKPADVLCFESAMAKLQEECFTIKVTENPDVINITKNKKNNETILCNFKTSQGETKLDPNNIGYKMMQKFGWSGGGLGSAQKGIENPLDVQIKNNRFGLGNVSGDINKAYFNKMLQNYAKSDEIRDLVFDSKFTKEERAELHLLARKSRNSLLLAQSKNLKSGSTGKKGNRQLCISKKNISAEKILEEVLIHRNPMYLKMYEVTVPVRKKDEFPDHVNYEESD